jgi:prevent-host-death family protein
MKWQLQDAKNKFSEVIDTSSVSGPQIITRRGKNTAVIISFKDYARLISPSKDLKKTLMSTGFDALNLAREVSTNGRATKFSL